MIWRKTSPLADQFLQIADVVRKSAQTLRAQQDQTPSELLALTP
jgi:hypothetical protein